MDYVQAVKSGVHGKTVINYVYYVKTKKLYAKTSSIRTETAFPLEMVYNALKKAGFKDVKFCNFDLAEVANPEERNKVHIIAVK